MDYNSPKFKKKVKSLQGKDLKTVQAEPKVEYTPTKQIGPYNTPTGFPEEQADKEAQPQIEKPKDGILNKIGSSMKKYIPLKKLMKEKYLREKKELGVVKAKNTPSYWQGVHDYFDPNRPVPPGMIPVGPLPGIGTGTWRDFIPDIIDGAWWLLHQKGNPSGDNPIVLPGVPQGGGGVHGQQPTNPNY